MLFIELEIFFLFGLVDIIEYVYVFLIGESGIYQQLDSMIDLCIVLFGEYEICGFFYCCFQFDSFLLFDGLLILDSICINLEGFEFWFCVEFILNCFQVSIQVLFDMI